MTCSQLTMLWCFQVSSEGTLSHTCTWHVCTYIYVHASILPQTPLPSRPPHSIEFPVLYRRSLLVLHFEYSSAYMSGTHPVHLRLVIRKLTPNSLLASDIQTGEEKSFFAYFSIQIPLLQWRGLPPWMYFFLKYLQECFLPLELRDPFCPGRKPEPFPGAESTCPPWPWKAVATLNALPPPAAGNSQWLRLITWTLIRVVFIMRKRLWF